MTTTRSAAVPVGERRDILETLRRQETILMDGAMGTELERLGVPFDGDGWSALAVRDHGDKIRRVHESYLHCGAQLHIVNSFALARHVLEPLGYGDHFDSFNRRVVTDFDDAVTHSGIARNAVWAAGSLSTFAAYSDRSLLPCGQTLIENYRDQARILRDAGVDLFAFEMLFDIEVSLAIYEAVEVFDLPMIFGFTCDWRDPGHSAVVSRSGIGRPPMPLSEILPAIVEAAKADNIIISIMHSDFDVTDAALGLLRRYWDGPVAIYPNSGHFVDLHLQFDSVCSEQAFAAAARRWQAHGVQIIGGCCGIGPTHIRAFSDSFD